MIARAAICRLPLALACLSFAASPALAKKGRVPATPQSQIQKVLQSKDQEIGVCVVEQLGSSAKEADVSASVTVDDKGQVVMCRVEVSLPSPGGDAVRGCVEKVLRGARYPSSKVPLMSISKKWHFAIAK
jgi:hypothetical protein